MANRFNRSNLIEEDTSSVWDDYFVAKQSAKDLTHRVQWCVFQPYHGPDPINRLCEKFSKGVILWLAVTEEEPSYLPDWVRDLDSDKSPDVYDLDGVFVYVGLNRSGGK